MKRLEPQHALTGDKVALAKLPPDPGIYAAWLTNSDAAAAAGLTSEGPVLLYVGKAAGKYGLRQRLRLHARSPWYSLLHALAAGGHVLPCWWVHSRKTGPHTRVVHPSGLAQVATEQALAWQHQHVTWGYTALGKAELTAVETALIQAHRPIINLAGRGYGSRGPLVRDEGGFVERARAWWLFRAAWLAVLSGEPAGYTRRSRLLRGSVEVAWDQHGWPVRLDDATASRGLVERRSEKANRRIVADACAPDLRHRAEHWRDSDEATAWVFAHTGIALRHGVELADALREALSLGAGFAGPVTLPGPETLIALHGLVSGRHRLISDVVH